MMKKWRELAWLVGLGTLAALLIAFAILLALRLSAGPARAANEPPAPCLQLRRAGGASGGSAGRGST